MKGLRRLFLNNAKFTIIIQKESLESCAEFILPFYSSIPRIKTYDFIKIIKYKNNTGF